MVGITEKAWDLAEAHWKPYAKLSFPNSLKGQVVNGYDCEDLARRANFYLDEIFVKGQYPSVYGAELSTIHPQLAEIASGLHGRDGCIFGTFQRWCSFSLALLQKSRHDCLCL